MTTNKLQAMINELKGTNKLYKRVINEIIADSKNYDGTKLEQIKSRCEDVAHGLSSGIVSSLVYYNDTTKFFKLYKKEIGLLVAELQAETGKSIIDLLRDFDETDIFCNETANQNLLAWFAYEEINNQLINRLEEL